MKGIAHMNADGVVKIAIPTTAFKNHPPKLRFTPGVGRMDIKSAIELFGDLLFCSNRYMVAEVSDVRLEQAVKAASNFTLDVKVDENTGSLTWT